MASPGSATTLCTNPSPGCNETAAWPAETPLQASLEEGTEALFSTSVANVTCSSASIEGQLGAEAGEPLPVEITVQSFAECKVTGSGSACTATALSLPSGALEANGSHGGTLALEGGELHLKCGALINCKYLVPSLEVEGGEPARLVAEEVGLEKVGGLFCPSTSTLDATYTLSEPEPAYVEA